ncbi:alpha/beta hydrolase [Candidatus Gracilibacteria bacterium]|nr:alpha/beta hydrolase [Candidatus Gracilibacteria bacterium]
MQEKKIHIGKHEVFYKEFGNTDKPVLVILHGWGGSSVSWINFSKFLEKTFHIFIPDLPGFGKTEIGETFTLEKYAELVESFVQKLQIGEYILWGHSNGGAIASVVAHRNNTQIKKMVLNNSAGIRNDKKRGLKRKILGMLSFGRNFPGYKFIRPYFHRLIGAQDYTQAEKNEYLRDTYKNMIQSDLQDVFPLIQVPVLMLWGSADTYTPVSDAYTIKRLIPDVKLKIVDGERHGIHLHAPEKLKQYFLENI